MPIEDQYVCYHFSLARQTLSDLLRALADMFDGEDDVVLKHILIRVDDQDDAVATVLYVRDIDGKLSPSLQDVHKQ